MACDENGIVGKNDTIPWYYPDEFQHFRDTIGSNPIIIGRKTFELVPKTILKNRISIVFSRARKKNISNVIFISSLEDFFSLDIFKKKQKMFIIGGAQLANYFLSNNLISEFILTIIRKSYIGDAVLNIKAFDSWQSEVISRLPEYDIYRFIKK